MVLGASIHPSQGAWGPGLHQHGESSSFSELGIIAGSCWNFGQSDRIPPVPNRPAQRSVGELSGVGLVLAPKGLSFGRLLVLLAVF